MYYIGCFEIEKHLANVIAEELIDALNEHVPPYGTYTKLNDTMHLQVGDHAPAFTSKDQEEKTIQLADFAGKKLVLYFYPKDNTPGCTAQACNLRDNYQALQQAGVFSIYFYNTNPFHKSHFVRLTPYAMCKKSWRR